MSTFISGPGNFQGISLDPDINIRKEDYVGFIKGGRWIYLTIGILLLLFIALSIMTIILYFNLAYRERKDTDGKIIENTISEGVAKAMAGLNIVIVIVAIGTFIFILIKFITFKKWRHEQFRKDLDMARAEQESKAREVDDSRKREVLDNIRKARQRDLEAGIVGAYVGGEDIQSLELDKDKLVKQINTLEASATQIEINKKSFEAERDGIEATITELSQFISLNASGIDEAKMSPEQKALNGKYKDSNQQYLAAQLDQLRKYKDAAMAKIGLEDTRLAEVKELKSDVEAKKIEISAKIGEIQEVNAKREARETLDKEISRYEKTDPALAETLKLRRDELRRGDAASAEESNIEKIKKLTGLTEKQINEAKATAQAEQKAKEDPIFRVAWEKAKREKAKKAREMAEEDREREAINLLVSSGLNPDEAEKTYKASLTASSEGVIKAMARLAELEKKKTEADEADTELEARLTRAKASRDEAEALYKASAGIIDPGYRKIKKEIAKKELDTATTALTAATTALDDALKNKDDTQIVRASDAFDKAKKDAELARKKVKAAGASLFERRKLRNALKAAEAEEAEVKTYKEQAEIAVRTIGTEGQLSEIARKREQEEFEKSSKYAGFGTRITEAEKRAQIRATDAATAAEQAATDAATAAEQAATDAATAAATPAGRAKAKEAELKAKAAEAEARKRELIAEQRILEYQQEIAVRDQEVEKLRKADAVRIQASENLARINQNLETATKEFDEARTKAEIAARKSQIETQKAQAESSAVAALTAASAEEEKKAAAIRLNAAQTRKEAAEAASRLAIAEAEAAQAEAAAAQVSRTGISMRPSLKPRPGSPGINPMYAGSVPVTGPTGRRTANLGAAAQQAAAAGAPVI